MKKFLAALGILSVLLCLFSCGFNREYPGTIKPKIPQASQVDTKPQPKRQKVVKLTNKQIQAINIINGESTECMMHAFFLDPSNKIRWKKINGMNGRKGIDGLYIKEIDGIIKDVLVAESKWNTSRLKRTKKGTVKQMSKEWILDALEKARPYNPDIANFDQIVQLVSKGIYRGRLFNLKPSRGKLKIILWHIKNKDDNKSIKKTGKSEIIIDLNHPRNPFYANMVKTFNSCRQKAIKKAFPEFSDEEINSLLKDEYIQKDDIVHIINN